MLFCRIRFSFASLFVILARRKFLANEMEEWIMRKSDREIKGFSEIVSVVEQCETIRLALHGQDYPYVVPLSFGFEVVNGRLHLYFHGAKQGYKHELIARDNRACVEADIFHQYADTPQGVTTIYESMIGFGHVELVEGDDAIHGLDLLLEHCGYAGYEYDHDVTRVTAVYRVVLEQLTGKRRTLSAGA